MEGLFDHAVRAMTSQMHHLEAQCNDVMNTMKAENDRLRQDLWAAGMAESPKMSVAEKKHSRSWLLAERTPSASSLPQDIPVEHGFPLTPRPMVTPIKRQVSPATNQYKHREKACLHVESAAEALCVTPKMSSRSNSFRSQTSLDHPADDPVVKTPNGALEVGLNSSYSSLDGIAGIMLLGNRIPAGSQLSAVDSNWARLYAGITTPKESRVWLAAKATVHKFELQPFWIISTVRSSAAGRHTNHSALSAISSNPIIYKSENGVRVGHVVKSRDSCLQPFTLHPEHKFALAHALVQGAMILFDVMDFPMSVFHSGDNQTKLADIMLIVSSLFWSWDLIFSFLVGFHTGDGVVEMRPSRIAHHYVRRWFVFDLLVVLLDWVSLVVFIMENASNRDSRIARATKLTKVQRIMRGGRILRLVKAIKKILSLLDSGTTAEQIIVIARIVGLVFLILLINHYIACGWYYIAESSTYEITWVTARMDEDAYYWEKYFYSMHWSLTQFTPCTTDIAPVNALERIFACFVCIFALIVFSAFLSSLTSAIMQMKKMNYERFKEEMQIRDFLHGKEVPLTVANRIWHYYRKHYRRRSKIVAEFDVPLFTVMPKSLRKELRSHAYFPILVTHLTLKELIEAPQARIGPLLCDVVTHLIPISGQDIFIEAELGTQMYFLVNGSGIYSFHDRDREDQLVHAPDYLSEAVLWLSDWHHLGRLSVTNHRCEFLVLAAGSFTSCIESEASEGTFRQLRKYASLFAQRLEDMEMDHRLKESSPTHLSLDTPDPSTETLERQISSIATVSDLALTAEIQTSLVRQAFPLTKSHTPRESIQTPRNSIIRVRFENISAAAGSSRFLRCLRCFWHRSGRPDA